MSLDNKKNRNPFYQTWMTVVYDNNLSIVDVINPQHCMLLQLTADVLLGMNVSDLENITQGPNKEPARIIAKNIRIAHKENRNVYFEYSTTHKDGSVTYAICFAEKGPDDLLYVNVLKIDEENIFEARDGFTNYVINATMNNISVGVYMRHIKDDGTKTYILFNDVAKEFYESDDIQQSKHWNQEEEDLVDEKTMELRDPLKIERVLRDEDGNIIRWLIVTKKKITSRAKGFYLVTTIIDITKRRQNEILLEQQFTLLDSMYEHLPVGIVIYDKNGRLVSLNQKEMDLFGLKDKESVLGQNIFDEPHTPADVKLRLKSGENVEYEVVYDFDRVPDKYFANKKSGKRILLVKSAVIKNKKGVTDGYLQICEDITEKKNAEQNLWRKHHLIETIYNTIPVGVELYDKDGRLIEINNHDMQVMGIENKTDVLGSSLFDDPNTPDDIKERTRRGENVEYTLEYDFDLARDTYYDTHISGKKYMDVKTSILRDNEGNIDGYLLISQDRTKNIERERLLEETATKFSSMFDAMSNGVEIYDKDGILIDCNDSDLKIFGLENKEELLRRKISIYDNPNVSHQELKSLLKGDSLSLNIDYDFDVVKQCNYYQTSKSGCITIEVKFAPIYVDKGEFIGYVAEVNDVTLIRENELILKKTQRDLNLALNAGNIAAWTFDVQAKVFRTLYGDALAGDKLTWEDNLIMLHPDDRKPQLDLFDSIIRGEKITASAIFRYLQPNGKYHHFESRMIAKENKGKVTVITGTQKDITEEVEYQQKLMQLKEEALSANQMLNQIIDCIPGGVYIKDASNDFAYIKANRVLCEIAGKKQNQVLGYTDFDILNSESAKRHRSYDLTLMKGEQKMVSYTSILLKDGVPEHWQINKSIVTTQDGNKLILGIVTNVTKFHEINKELQIAKEKAEQSDKLKSAFLANMSHEIRTPLNSIVGFSELLQITDDEQEKSEYINIINQNNDLLLRLIGDILDLSKIESGLIELKLEKFDLSATFCEAFTTLKTRCTNPQVEFSGVNPYKKCIVNLDKDRLLQVVTNFVTNALKYTPKGQITMGYEYVDGGVRIYVKDTGIGISKEKQLLLFQRFAKLDDFAQGTGLGLAISKAIIDVQKGTIGCESEEGEGSTFWAWMPCEAIIDDVDTGISNCPASSRAKDDVKAGIDAERRKAILIVEDNDSNYMLAKAILKEYVLTRAANGAEAVDLASRNKYDAILMNIKMPVMNGLEATRKIREFDKATPIIALTTNAFDSDKVDAMKAGCSAFIAKPLKKKELEKLLDR